MAAIDELVVGLVDPCPGGCGTLVRRFPNVEIRGRAPDGETSGPWWCPDCLQYLTDLAYEQALAVTAAARG